MTEYLKVPSSAKATILIENDDVPRSKRDENVPCCRFTNLLSRDTQKKC